MAIINGKEILFNPQFIEGNGGGLPIEVKTEAEMNALLVEENIGRIYRYTGETATYTQGSLYEVILGEGEGNLEFMLLSGGGGGGSSEPTLKYTLTEVVADPTKTDWNCFWFDDYGFQSDTERNQFQAGTRCTSNGSTQNLMYFTLESGTPVYLNAYYGTWQSYGFTGNGSVSAYCLRRYGSYNHNYYKFFPFSSPIASITLNATWLTQSEESRKKVTDHIYCGVI